MSPVDDDNGPMVDISETLRSIQQLPSSKASLKKYAAFAAKELAKKTQLTEQKVKALFKQKIPEAPCSFTNNGLIRWSELKNAACLGAPLELNPENFSFQGPLTLHFRDRTGILHSETLKKSQSASKAVSAYFPHVPAHLKSREDTATTLQRRIFQNSTVRTWFLKHSDKIKSSKEEEEEE